mmetsp:Transcript_9799/g.15516  ORF Transcript_9799/g.15516 Transcript_9799/m.15516 type:complete len:365 (+) Transcript_9799:2-1096(+)
MERRRHHILAGVASAVVLVATVAVFSTSAVRSELLSSDTWAWGDRPMTIDPMAAANQAASLASVVKLGFLAEQNKLAQLRMVQVSQMSETEAARPNHAAATAAASSKAFTSVPFSNEVAQRLQAVNGAAENAQAAASQALGKDVTGSIKLWKGSYRASPDLALPSRTTRNGLALDYFHLNTLPAATAVRFAKREVVGAMAKPAIPSPGLRNIDKMARKAFEQGTEIVVSRRQKAGILPMTINKGWSYSLKKVKEQVGENVVNAQMAVAKIGGGDSSAVEPDASHSAVADPLKAPAAAAPISTSHAKVAEVDEKKKNEQSKLGQLEEKLKRLKQENEMEIQLNNLKAKEATIENKYPQLHKTKAN